MELNLQVASKILRRQIELVDSILTHYVNDEAGASQKEVYKSMTPTEKLELLMYTIENCSDWSDFETDLIINFDYGMY